MMLCVCNGKLFVPDLINAIVASSGRHYILCVVLKKNVFSTVFCVCVRVYALSCIYGVCVVYIPFWHH